MFDGRSGEGVADVFISYKRDERPAVEQLAARLRDLGLNVWFDAGLSAGESFNDEIDREARAASIILVCWSPTARESKWVKAEAMIGFEQDKLAAIHVAGPDGFSPPTPFNTVHAEDLRAWIAAPSDLHSDAHAGWKSVLRRIGKLCARPDIESWGALDAQASTAELRAWIGAHEQSPLFMAVDAMLQAREEQDAERARLEQEARARRAREEATRLAQQQAERQAQQEAEGRAREAAERRHREEVGRREREDQEKVAREEKANAGIRIVNRIYLVSVTILLLVLFYFLANMANRPPSAPQQRAQIEEPARDLALAEEQTFEAASDRDTIASLDAFLAEFPDSRHGLVVRGRIAELRSVGASPTTANQLIGNWSGELSRNVADISLGCTDERAWRFEFRRDGTATLISDGGEAQDWNWLANGNQVSLRTDRQLSAGFDGELGENDGGALRVSGTFRGSWEGYFMLCKLD